MQNKKIILALTAATIGLGMSVAAPAVAAAPAATVTMHDDCDQASFDAGFGAGTCVGSGTTTLADFFAQLATTGQVTGWSFRPQTVRVAKGTTVRAVDTGGEAHTFTRVDHFGGGCIALLNAIMGLTPVPECNQTVLRDGKPVPKFAATLVLPGGSRTAGADRTGTIRFECLIHPWMRAELKVS